MQRRRMSILLIILCVCLNLKFETKRTPLRLIPRLLHTHTHIHTKAIVNCIILNVIYDMYSS